MGQPRISEGGRPARGLPQDLTEREHPPPFSHSLLLRLRTSFLGRSETPAQRPGRVAKTLGLKGSRPIFQISRFSSSGASAPSQPPAPASPPQKKGCNSLRLRELAAQDFESRELYRAWCFHTLATLAEPGCFYLTSPITESAALPSSHEDSPAKAAPCANLTEICVQGLPAATIHSTRESGRQLKEVRAHAARRFNMRKYADHPIYEAVVLDRAIWKSSPGSFRPSVELARRVPPTQQTEETPVGLQGGSRGTFLFFSSSRCCS